MVAVLWGCAVFIFADTNDFSGTFLIIIIVICVIAGGSYYSVPVWPAVIGLILLGALPIAVFMLMRDSSAEKINGVIAFFLTATLIRISIVINGWLVTSINRGLVNEHQSRQLETALEKSSLTNRVQPDFLANISHEINTPITGLLGTLQLLRTNPEPDESARFLNIANNSARMLQVLMNDLLDMSKLQSGQFSIHTSPVDLINLLDESITLLRPMATEKNLLLKVETTLLQPHFFHISDARMRQIFYNLVGNTIKFTNSGTVVVSIRCEAISPTTYSLHCDIENTGIGIASGATELLFERFTQADTAQSRTRTGLGLAWLFVANYYC
jgi:signal transduction histidine kinase